MIIPSDSKFAPWKWVEVAAYKKWFDKERQDYVEAVIREKIKKHRKDPGIPVLLEWGDDVKSYSAKRDHTGVYTTVWRYNSKDVTDASLFGPVYFDLDSEDLNISLEEAQILYRFLCDKVGPNLLSVYFTGKKGFHIEIEPIPLGVTPSKDLPGICRTIAENIEAELGLETLDFAVYDKRRMWRLPDTRHQKTGLYKILLAEEDLFSSPPEILELAKTPLNFEYEDLSKFNIKANEWYRGHVSQYYEAEDNHKKELLARRLEAFNKYGQRILDGPNRRYLDKVWGSVVESMEDAGKAGEGSRNDTLSEQSFKMFCKALKSKEADVDMYFDKLIELGVAVGLGERETEATVTSALRAAKSNTELQTGV